MKNTPKNMHEILNRNIPGFHQYCLSVPFRLIYASQNLSDMLGLPKAPLSMNRKTGMPCVCIRRTGNATRHSC